MSELRLTPAPNPEVKVGDAITVVDRTGVEREFQVVSVPPEPEPDEPRTVSFRVTSKA